MSERIFIPVKRLEVVNNVIRLPYPDSQETRIGTVNNVVYRSIMQFDFSALPVGSTVDNSFFTLYIEYQAQPLEDKVFAIHKITQNWSSAPNTICPIFDPVPAAVFTVGQGTTQVNVDITGLTEDWIRDPQRNFGMLIKSLDENIGNTEIRVYCTKAKNTQLWPSLTLSFNNIEVNVEPIFVKQTENGLIAQTYSQFSAARKMGKAIFSSFFVKNTGLNSLIVQLQVSADGLSYVPDGKEKEVLSGEEAIFVPKYFGEFDRIAYRSGSAGQVTTLDIIYVAKLI
ncbi:MAG: DNRLRE domain-containing protein [Peptococcaceae bacterium]|nr:DNRLRE domain-containing protein [Peptococcaceae bacterium]